MRIISGRWRGRRLVSPEGLATRPTGERLRQAMFDMLRHASWAPSLEGARVLDLFCGTGALGLEALSRGAAGAVFVEQDRAAVAALHGNIAACRAETVAEVQVGDACRPLPGGRADVVFLDPPYGQGMVAAALRSLGARADSNSLVVAELGRDEAAEGFATIFAERAHGAGRVVFGRIGSGHC